jgi:hypothetical protein
MNTKNLLFKSSSNRRTNLDKAYNSHIINLFERLDEEKKARWETYNLIIEVLTECTKKDFMKEIKYRITDGEDPNKIMLDIIERQNESVDGLVWFLKKRVEEYIDEDFFNRFLF